MNFCGARLMSHIMELNIIPVLIPVVLYCFFITLTTITRVLAFDEIGVIYGHSHFQPNKEDIMKERTGLVSMKGNPVTLLGDEVKVGRKAPAFQAVDNDLKPYTFEPGQDKITILASVPSLDTPVCDMETRRFNQEAAALGKDVRILTISMDLPFAQKRWCAAAGVESVKTLSDHRDASFGLAYGLLIKEVRLLARAVLVLDKEGIIRHMELVEEVGHEPDYAAVLEAVKLNY